MSLKRKKYYSLTETNEFITNRVLYFTPKGMNKYYATLEFKWGDIKESYIFDSDHRVTVKKFGNWIKPQIDSIENDFYKKVHAIKLECYLNNKQLLPVSDVVGNFDAYVVL